MLSRQEILLNLDINAPNATMQQHLLQGSEDKIFKISLLNNGKEVTIEDDAIVELAIIYQVETQVNNGCNSVDPKTYLTYLLKPTDVGYNITISDSMISVPVDNKITNAHGLNLLVLKVKNTDSDDITSYNYQIGFVCDENKAYNPVSIVTHIEDFDDLKKSIDNMKISIGETTAKADKAETDSAAALLATSEIPAIKVTTNQNKIDITNKADKDLSNVQTLLDAPDGAIIYKKDGKLKHSALLQNDLEKKIKSTYDLQIPGDSLYFGLNTSIHQNGGFLEYHTLSLDKNYILLDYLNDPEIGSQKPIYYERLAKERYVFKGQDGLDRKDNIEMKNVQKIAFGQTQFDHQVQSLFLNFAKAVTNLRIDVEVNNEKVESYPIFEPGYNLGSGVHEIKLKPFFSSLVEYNINLILTADVPIDLMGDGTSPWVSENLNRINRFEIALQKDINAASSFIALTDTPSQIIANKMVITNALGNALIFTDMPSATDTSSLANKDLSNVLNTDFKNKSVTSGMLQQDLEDVDLSKLYDKGTDAKLADLNIQNNLVTEINRLKTDISNITPQTLPTYVFRDKGIPSAIPTDKQYKAYYIHSLVLQNSNQVLNIPTNAPDGAIFSVENNDRDDYLSLRPPVGETINGNAGIYQCEHDTLNYFVKDGTDFKLAYGGVFPNNYSAMKSTIQALFPNSLHTLAEVESQLKDRLHTFREIQSEFSSQLHTLSAIETDMESKGFLKEGGKLGMQGDQSIPIDDAWSIDPFRANQEILIPAQNKGNQYLIFTLPPTTSAIISKVIVNNAEIEFSKHDFVDNELHYKVFIADNTIDSSQTVRFKLEFDLNIPVAGIELDDGINNVSGITKINTNLKISNINDKEITLNSDEKIKAIDDNKNVFDVSKIQSLDRKIRISNLGSGTVDLDADYNTVTDGIFAKLGNDEDINTDFHDQRPWFGDIYDNSGKYVGVDMNDKAFTIQEGDMLDPNISGGSTFNVGMYFEPLDNPIASDNGYVELKIVELSLVDNSVKGYLLNIDGNPIAIRREYKANDIIGKELLLGVVRAKGQKRIAFEIDVQFPSQILRTSSNTSMYIQEVDKDHNSGLCELLFQRHTGYTINTLHRYYGVNNMNLASALVKNKPQTELNAENELMGNGMFIDSRSKVKVDITNYHITMQDNGADLPIFSLGKIWDNIDSFELREKILNAKIVLTNKHNAFRYALMKWTGTGQATLPILNSYNNGSPIFSSGWVKVMDKFVAEDITDGEHIDTNAFTIPSDVKQIAILIYPSDTEIPTVLKLKDFEVDVSPAITKTIIQSTSHITEEHLKNEKWMYKAVVSTPSGYINYRYTINIAQTKLPIGVIKGGNGKIINDNSWHDAGSVDPNKTQGDFKFLADGKVTVEYTIQIKNEQNSENEITFWMAKNNGDGTFDELPQSEYQGKIAANTKHGIFINKKFVVDVKENEIYRFFGDSDKDDGFYLESTTDGRAMIEFIIDFEELTEYEKNVVDLMQHADEIIFVDNEKPVVDPSKYRLEIDVKTGQTEIKEV